MALFGGGSRGWREDVLRSLEIGAGKKRLVNEEILRTRFGRRVPARVTRLRDRSDRVATRDVNDIKRRPGDLCEVDGARGRLGLGQHRPGLSVIARFNLSL